MSPYDISKKLAKSLKETNEYKVLIAKKSKVDQEPQLKGKIDSLEKTQLEVIKSDLSDEQKQKSINEIQKEFEKLSKVPQVAEFLKAGEDFNKIVEKTYKIIDEEINKEL
ncbi:MAG: YlbF family regulator [Eubacteriales bacterium]